MTDKKKNELQSPLVFNFYVSKVMGADASVVKRFCNYMSTKERAHYLDTFKRNGKTIAENVAIDMQDILKEKFNCVVYEPMLVDIVEINEKECTFTPEFLVDVEYHFDESENIEPSKVREDLKNVLRKGFRSDWMID